MMRGANVSACLVMIVAASGTMASASVSVEGRLSRIETYGFAGNGPVIQQHSDFRESTSITTSSSLTLNTETLLNDEFWGSGFAQPSVQQSDQLYVNGSEGFEFAGAASTTIESRPTANSQLGTTPITFGQTSAISDLVFTVTQRTAWSLQVSALRNPPAGFAVRLWSVTPAGTVYLTPLVTPIDDFASGLLEPGQYKLEARMFAGTTASALGIPSLDATTNQFVLRVGTIPVPSGAAIFGLGCVILVRRRRGET